MELNVPRVAIHRYILRQGWFLRSWNSVLCGSVCNLPTWRLVSQVPEVAFTGDTSAEFLSLPSTAEALRAKLLIMEMTYVDDSVTVEKAVVGNQWLNRLGKRLNPMIHIPWFIIHVVAVHLMVKAWGDRFLGVMFIWTIRNILNQILEHRCWHIVHTATA